jgi:L-aminopeptidase/D-esterase-like protein
MEILSPNNCLTDIRGIQVGHYTDREAASGVTVILCPRGAVAAVDVRGAAPGTRETDLLRPENLVDRAHALVLSGGSAYGLSSADGVVRWLAERRIGFPAGAGMVVPIVPAAVLFDLGRGEDPVPPINAAWGYGACGNAASGRFETGSVGAGTGARAGSIKGGVGTSGAVLEWDASVAALAVVNSLGSVIDPESGQPWEIAEEVGGEFGQAGKRRVRVPGLPESGLLQNTTLGVVATDVSLSKAQSLRLAQMAHAGLARAVRPAHTNLDGDVVFCLATGEKRLCEENREPVLRLNGLGEAAARCLSRAIVHAILDAEGLGGIPAFRELPVVG